MLPKKCFLSKTCQNIKFAPKLHQKSVDLVFFIDIRQQHKHEGGIYEQNER